MSGEQEKLHISPEQNVEIKQQLEQPAEKLNENAEKNIELSPRDIEAKAEKARVEALENAISVEAGGVEKQSKKGHSASSRRGSIGKKQHDASFKQTIKQVQNELPVSGRVFSKFIHNKAVEGTTNALGSTIARPNAILAGAFTAFALTLITYIIAKTIGYSLSGSETIFAFIIGWLIGIIYDYFRLLITGKKI